VLLQPGQGGVLVGPVGAGGVADPARRPGQAQHPVEHEVGGAPGGQRVRQRVPAEGLVGGAHGHLGAVAGRRLGPRVGIQQVDLDVAEAVLGQVAADGGRRLLRVAAHQADVDPGHRPAGHDRLAAGADVAGGQPRDVHGRPEQQRLQQLGRPAVEPVAGRTRLAQVRGRVEAGGQLGQQPPVAVARPGAAVEAGDQDLLVGAGEGGQGLDQGPRRRGDPGLLAGVQVDGGAAPVAGLGDQLQVAEALAAQDQLRLAVEAGGQVQVEGALGGEVAGPRPDRRGQVGAAQLLLALDHQGDGQRHGVQLAQDLDGQEEAGQAALGVGAAPGHDRPADPGQVADLGRERRRGPGRLLGRLDVVHAVAQQPGRARRAGQLADDQRVAGRWDQLERPAGALDPGPGGLGHGRDPLAGGAHRRHLEISADPLQVGREALGHPVSDPAQRVHPRILYSQPFRLK
jgi:hypothetical protein